MINDEYDTATFNSLLRAWAYFDGGNSVLPLGGAVRWNVREQWNRWSVDSHVGHGTPLASASASASASDAQGSFSPAGCHLRVFALRFPPTVGRVPKRIIWRSDNGTATARKRITCPPKMSGTSTHRMKKDESFLGKLGGTLVRKKRSKEGWLLSFSSGICPVAFGDAAVKWCCWIMIIRHIRVELQIHTIYLSMPSFLLVNSCLTPGTNVCGSMLL